MPTHHIYTNETFPSHLAYQRLSFIRMLWIGRYVDNPHYHLQLDPRSVRYEVYVESDALVSSISVIKTSALIGAALSI